MQQPPETNFDFEEWALLAKTDPHAFEIKREEAIARLIAGASPRTQTRLRGLQWKIDTERRLASNPLSSCIQIFNQMWKSVYGERGLLDALHGLEGPPLPERPSAVILKLDHQDGDQVRNTIPHPSTHP
jgi:hypothetical protein